MIELILHRKRDDALAARCDRVSAATSDNLDPVTRAVLYLRAAAGRASFTLPAFYFFVGASAEIEKATKNYQAAVRASFLQFSSLATISLAARKTFDESNRTNRLSGKALASLNSEELDRLAGYWAGKRETALESPRHALQLLQRVIGHLSRQRRALVEAPDSLSKRVLLLREHANRCAAHISLDDYEVAIDDVLHVVAILVVFADIINQFDDPTRSSNHFVTLDQASYAAAKEVFPDLPECRLFENFDLRSQTRIYLRRPLDSTVAFLLNQLPFALG